MKQLWRQSVIQRRDYIKIKQRKRTGFSTSFKKHSARKGSWILEKGKRNFKRTIQA